MRNHQRTSQANTTTRQVQHLQ